MGIPRRPPLRWAIAAAVVARVDWGGCGGDGALGMSVGMVGVGVPASGRRRAGSADARLIKQRKQPSLQFRLIGAGFATLAAIRYVLSLPRAFLL
jgi:hypothetical protein